MPLKHKLMVYIAIVLFSAVLARGSQAQYPTQSPAVINLEQASGFQAIIDGLMEGNKRFASGVPARPRATMERLRQTAAGQAPLASILTCSDSRVTREFLFDQGIGDLFVVRVAGNVADTDEIGTLEYGVGHLHTPVLVVLGHTKCGAVNAVSTKAKVHGQIPALVDNIAPAVARAAKHNCPACSHDAVTRAIYENVWVSIEDIFARSEEVRLLVVSGKLKVVGAVYDLSNGTVQWLGEHKSQAKLIARGSKAGAEPSHGAGRRSVQRASSH